MHFGLPPTPTSTPTPNPTSAPATTLLPVCLFPSLSECPSCRPSLSLTCFVRPPLSPFPSPPLSHAALWYACQTAANYRLPAMKMALEVASVVPLSRSAHCLSPTAKEILVPLCGFIGTVCHIPRACAMNYESPWVAVNPPASHAQRVHSSHTR